MSKCVLTVDDSASIRNMVTFTLKAAGYEVVEAADGQEGLDKAKAAPSTWSSPTRTCRAWTASRW